MDELLPGVIGRSEPMQRLSELVRSAAPLGLPVLIRGETGVGKELVAHALHRLSGRHGRLVALNAATIEHGFAESELFGHVRGAFTGASRDRLGAFRQAHAGTLLLDEVGSLPENVQAKLLRVLEEGVVRPMGGDDGHPVDVRVVAATCEPLEQLRASGRFRADLYERLAGCVVVVPPLRDRRHDLGLLAIRLLAQQRLGAGLSPSAFDVLARHRWPGNVRELRHVLAQAALLARGDAIEGEHVMMVLAARTPSRQRVIAPAAATCLLARSRGNISAAARRAGMARSTFRDLLKRAGRRRGAGAPRAQKVPTTPTPPSVSLMIGSASTIGPRGSACAAPPALGLLSTK